MNSSDLARPHILNQPVYEPGKPIEHVAREFGLDPDEIVKLASNENPLGPSPKAREAASRALEHANFYPDGGCWFLRHKLAEALGARPEQLVFGNGSNEIIELAGHVFLGPDAEAVMGEQSFAVYKLVTLLFNAAPVEVPMPDYKHDLDAMLDAVTDRARMVFLPSPNNPTGTANTAREIDAFVEKLPDHVIFIFDEAYAEYLDDPPDLRPWIKKGKKILCCRTFSKIYGLAGLRLGYGYGPEELIGLLQRAREPFNANAIAQAAALAALDDHAFVEETRRINKAGMAQLENGFNRLGVEFVPSRANFILFKVEDAPAAFQYLQSRGVIIRPIPSLPGHLRATIGTESQNRRLLDALEGFLKR